MFGLTKRRALSKIAKRINENARISPSEMRSILNFDTKEKSSKFIDILKKLALPLSILLGLLIAIYPEWFEARVVNDLPVWTNLSPRVVMGLDYIWNILSEPVERSNIIYHIPNIILYSFGIIGIKKLLDMIKQRSWLNKVIDARNKLINDLMRGSLRLNMKKGNSILFVGNGDYIGMQFALNNNEDGSVTLSSKKPGYTNIWNFYDVNSSFSELSKTLSNIEAKSAGEYVFFPVKDSEIFLPGITAYDLSPHRLELIIQDIRKIEKVNNWEAKRIIIIGDKLQKSIVKSEDNRGMIEGSEDNISINSIAEKFANITVVDPTDLVLKKIIELAGDRKIIFRASIDGLKEYRIRFYYRLSLLGYKVNTLSTEEFIVGYDIFEDQLQQQVLSKKIDNYYPVVISKSVNDALIRNGYEKDQFIYVPDLVLEELQRLAIQQ